ncbi:MULTISPECIES: hypothetical protein [Bacillus cereus group]|nr:MULTISPECIES: hypothetical protein [Bacillus cereus group]
MNGKKNGLAKDVGRKKNFTIGLECRRGSGTMNVRELKEIIKDMDDDIEVVARAHNFELGGAIVNASAHEMKYKKEREQFVDAFDRTPYSKEVYKPDFENGKVVLLIGGF